MKVLNMDLESGISPLSHIAGKHFSLPLLVLSSAAPDQLNNCEQWELTKVDIKRSITLKIPFISDVH